MHDDILQESENPEHGRDGNDDGRRYDERPPGAGRHRNECNCERCVDKRGGFSNGNGDGSNGDGGSGANGSDGSNGDGGSGAGGSGVDGAGNAGSVSTAASGNGRSAGANRSPRKRAGNRNRSGSRSAAGNGVGADGAAQNGADLLGATPGTVDFGSLFESAATKNGKLKLAPWLAKAWEGIFNFAQYLDPVETSDGIQIWPLDKTESTALGESSEALLGTLPQAQQKKLKKFLDKNLPLIMFTVTLAGVAGPRAKFSLDTKRAERQKSLVRTASSQKIHAVGRERPHAGAQSDITGAFDETTATG